MQNLDKKPFMLVSLYMEYMELLAVEYESYYTL